MHRSGAITPRRAAWARSKRDVWVGKRSATWRAISAPGRCHADEHRAGPVANAGARLLAERRVCLVADHDRVGVRDPAGVADEPLVGLDRDRSVGMIGVVEQRRAEALLVAAVGDLADELIDEVAAVGEDQDAAGAAGIDEPDRGDGLPGPGRVLEPEPAARPGILGRLGDDVRVLGLGLVPVLRLLVGGEDLVVGVELLVEGVGRLGGLAVGGRLGAAIGTAVAPRLALRALELGCDRGQGPGEGVDLVLVELRAVEQLRLAVPEQALEAEQERVVASPLERRVLGAALELGERGVDGASPGGARRQVGDRLALEQDRLTGELPHSIEVGLGQLARRACGNVSGIGHWQGNKRPRASRLIVVERGGRSNSEEGCAGPRSPPAGPATLRGPRNTGTDTIEPHRAPDVRKPSGGRAFAGPEGPSVRRRVSRSPPARCSG